MQKRAAETTAALLAVFVVAPSLPASADELTPKALGEGLAYTPTAELERIQATHGTVVRRGKELIFWYRQGEGRIFADWQTSEGDGDMRANIYMEGTGRYQALLVEYGQGAPGTFVINMINGEVRGYNSTEEDVYPSPNRRYLVSVRISELSKQPLFEVTDTRGGQRGFDYGVAVSCQAPFVPPIPQVPFDSYSARLVSLADTKAIVEVTKKSWIRRDNPDEIRHLGPNKVMAEQKNSLAFSTDGRAWTWDDPATAGFTGITCK